MKLSEINWVITLVFLFLCDVFCIAAEPANDSGTESHYKTSVKHLQSASNAAQSKSTIENRVREITWRLLAGEIAANSNIGLSSSAYDALTRGSSELEQLLAEIDNSPKLEKELVANPQIAVRLDAAQVRLSEVNEKKQITRSDELARLSQLRDINRAYRTLLQHLIAGQTQSIVGQPKEVAKQGDLALKQLQIVEKAVGKRRDYYLFDDEPTLNQPSDELKLIKELASPYAINVRRHQQALLGLSLANLAIATQPPNKELLEAALVQADASLEGASVPSSVALYVQGLCCLELGRAITAPAPFSKQAHANALDWFQKSKKALVEAKKTIPSITKQTVLVASIDRLLQESLGPQSFHSQASVLLENENTAGAIKTLYRGITLHRTPSLALAWIESRWRYGDNSFKEFEKLIASTLNEGVVKENDIEYRSLLGRVRVLHAWSLISDISDADKFKNKRELVLAVLSAGRSDLLIASKQSTIAPDLKRRLEAFLALAETTMLLIDSDHDSANAYSILGQIPNLVRELENDILTAEGNNRNELLESVQLARIAEGYLTLRLLPNYADRTRAAFASAADVAAKLPGRSNELRPIGAATLRAMLFRDDATDNRIAQEERQLRSALQKILPALISVSVAEPQKIAEALSLSLLDVQEKEPHWDPRKQMDERDIAGARKGVVADIRTVTVLSLLSAKQPAAALHTVLLKWYPELTENMIAQVDWVDVRKRSALMDDPLSVYALGFALEDFAVAKLDQENQIRAALLKDALANYEHAIQILSNSTLWRERWPYLHKLAAVARDRLVDEKAALKIAMSFRAEFRIKEAREALQKASKRHPGSILIQEQLIATLMDEAVLTPENKTKILTLALNELEDAKKNGVNLSIGSLAMLGDLQEQFGRLDAAINSYRELSIRTNNRALKIKAESRLAIIMARTGE